MIPVSHPHSHPHLHHHPTSIITMTSTRFWKETRNWRRRRDQRLPRSPPWSGRPGRGCSPRSGLSSIATSFSRSTLQTQECCLLRLVFFLNCCILSPSLHRPTSLTLSRHSYQVGLIKFSIECGVEPKDTFHAFPDPGELPVWALFDVFVTPLNFKWLLPQPILWT